MWPGVLSEDVLTPELMLPVQFQDIWSRMRASSPERELMLAMVSQAVADIQKHRYARRREGQRLYMEAYNWMSSTDTTWSFSFENLCRTLGLAPEALRDELLGVKQFRDRPAVGAELRRAA
jgi:hypothetical protein